MQQNATNSLQNYRNSNSNVAIEEEHEGEVKQYYFPENSQMKKIDLISNSDHTTSVQNSSDNGQTEMVYDTKLRCYYNPKTKEYFELKK